MSSSHRFHRHGRFAINQWLGYIATALAVTGVVLNNYRSRWCFLLWLFSNLLCLRIHSSARLRSAAGMGAMMVRDIIFIVLAVHGYLVWSGKV